MTLRRSVGRFRDHISLTGRLLAILLTILVIDFGINSLQFERESAVLVNADEAARIGEYLAVARRVMDATPPRDRAEAARRLTTSRISLAWRPRRADADLRPSLPEVRQQVVAAERSLADADLHVRTVPGPGGGLSGSALLKDGSVIAFRSASFVSWTFNLQLILRLTLPSVALFGLGWWLVRRSMRPLSTLVTATSQVGTDDMEHLSEQGEREVKQLVRAFNRMHDRIRQLIENRTEAMLAIGHDLRTPMARLQLRLDAVPLDEATRGAVAADIAEMSGLIDSLRLFVESGEQGGPIELIDLAAMVRTQVDDAADQGFAARYDGPDRLEIHSHAVGLRRAAGNLLNNALRHAGSVEVRLARQADEVELVFADRGPGIPEPSLGEVRQPFFRLDEARSRNTAGMGLGLAIVERIVTAAGGRLVLANRPGGGLEATIIHPVRPRGRAERPGNAS